MSDNEYLYLKSQNIWFGISQADVNFVKMNQKPGWFPNGKEKYSGFYLIEDQVYKIIHLNFLFGETYKPFIPAHMVTLKKHLGEWALACQELKTDIHLPSASKENYKNWIKDDYQSLLTHWFPVETDNLKQFLSEKN